ncbi:MAG: tetratricopeptide repeat protein, partial [Acidimicrobiales bacterium]
ALARLVSRSMVTRLAGTTPPAFHLLESVRHFARARLRDADEDATTRARIAEHVVRLGAEARLWIDGPDQLQWFDRLERALPSIRIAVDHLLEHDPVVAHDLRVGLYQFWMARASRPDARRWIEVAYERAAAPDPGLASRVLADAATFAYFCGSLSQSRSLSERSILVSEQGAQPARPTALLRLAALQAFDGDPEAAVTTGAQALDTLDAVHVPPEPPETMAAIGAFLAIVGQAERGVEVCRAAIDRHRSPSPTTEASDLVNLAYAHRLLDPDEAVIAYQAALVRARAAGSRFYMATAAMGAGLSLRAAGRGDEALVLLAEALPMARDIGMRDEVLVMLKAAARVLRLEGSVDGDLLFLVAEREQQARHWEGGPTLGRRPVRSPSEVAAEIGAAYAELRVVAAELDVDQAIDLVDRAAARVHAPSGA